MRIMGISSMFHDAAVTMLQDSDIVFAAHAERYSKQKNDPFLNHSLISEALSHGRPDQIVLHEKSWAKRIRHLQAKDFRGFREPTQKDWITKFYPELKNIPVKSYWHHETHAAAGVLTSEFDNCAVMVIDAIGEFDTMSIWHWHSGRLYKKHSVKFPHSLGLFYSAVTQNVGLKPMEDEYILMGMAAYGDEHGSQVAYDKILDDLFDQHGDYKFSQNLQRGLPENYLEQHNIIGDFEKARAAQQHAQEQILKYAHLAKKITGESNLVYMGGVALNCSANSLLYDVFDNVYIMPNPGDAGSSLGAAALEYHNRTGNRIDWHGPYLGHDIPGTYPIHCALKSLENKEVFGIANGRAEFGPRALGNRSLLADPRGGDIRDKVNAIKHRQAFRPFAPVILEHLANEYFDMPADKPSPYMQFVATCKHPDQYPAIVHHDGTSRVQTVNYNQNSGLFKLLEAFYSLTGCPMLLNTSLNIKGQPIVNDEMDAYAFSERYGVKVHTHD